MGRKTAQTLVAIYLALLAAPAMAQDYDQVHPCDEYAAHPDDVNRWAKGVEDADIIPGPAVKHCRDAVADYAAVPRFQFQLGRALWAARKTDEAVKTFLALEEAHEYPPVYAYLGQAFYEGLGGIDADEAMALTLFELAAADGFGPAIDILAELADPAAEDELYAEEGPEADQPVALASATSSAPQAPAAPVSQAPAPQPAAPQPADTQQQIPFDPSKYAQPDIIRALATGNLAEMKVRGIGKTNYAGLDNLVIYINNFHGEFSGSFNMKDPTCVALYDPMLERQLQARATNAVMGTNNNETAARGLNMLGQMLTDMARNDGMNSMINMQQAAQAVAASGSKDAAQLIILYGCQSEIVQRIYANIAAYAFNKTPLRSAEEKQRVAIEEQKKREDQARAAQRARVDDARKSCVQKFKQDTFCGCLITDLQARNLSDQEWSKLGASFSEVLAIAKAHDGVAEKISACRQKG